MNICKSRKKENMKITRLKHGVHVYSNIVPLSESREMLKTTFAFFFLESVLSLYLLGSGQHSLNGKGWSRRAIKRFKKCFLIMFKYFKHENCATNPFRLGLWSTEFIIHPTSGIRGVSNMKSNQKKC